MVVGHTIKDEVTILCHDKQRKKSLICIDTGMSNEYGGLPYAVKIVDGKTIYIYNSKTNDTTMIDLETNERFEISLLPSTSGFNIRMILTCLLATVLLLMTSFLCFSSKKQLVRETDISTSRKCSTSSSPVMIPSPPTIQFKLDNEKKIQGSRKSIRYDFINPQHFENGHLRKTL